MKTLKQIKEEVAKEYDFDSYLEMIDYEDGFDICIIDEIANRYAKEQLLLNDVDSGNDFDKTLICKNGDIWALDDNDIKLWESNGDIKEGDRLYKTVLINKY